MALGAFVLTSRSGALFFLTNFPVLMDNTALVGDRGAAILNDEKCERESVTKLN